MRRAALGLLLGIPLLASASVPDKPADFTMSWVVTIDRDGKLGAMTPTGDGNRDLYQRLEAGIRKYWLFKPGKVDGKAETTETTLTVHASLEPADGAYRVRVREAETGPRYDRIVAPRYPDDALMARRGGGVLIEVEYDATGNVTGAKSIAGGEPKPGHDVERAAAIAVRQWKLKPETIGGHGLAGKALVPLCFAPTPAAPKNCRWETGATKKPLDADRPLALSSVTEVATDVTAHEL